MRSIKFVKNCVLSTSSRPAQVYLRAIIVDTVNTDMLQKQYITVEAFFMDIIG